MKKMLPKACLAALILLACCLPALASPIVQYSVSSLAGGFFEYDLIVKNQGGSEPFKGLIVLNRSSIFNLDNTSAIGTPANWSFSAPLPGLVNNLFYFSLTPSADIPIGGELMGFSFQSSTAPASLNPGDFAVEAIGAISSSQIPLGDAVMTPEPSTIGPTVFMLIACLLVAVRSRTLRS